MSHGLGFGLAFRGASALGAREPWMFVDGTWNDNGFWHGSKTRATAGLFRESVYFDGGSYDDEAAWGDQYLRNTRLLFGRLEDGLITQVILSFFGDSWIQGNYWTKQFAKTLQDQYGFAGLGWVGFQWFGTASGAWVDGGAQPSGGGAGCARNDLSSAPIFDGEWSSENGGGGIATPSIGNASTSDDGAYVRFDFPAGHDSADLYYDGDGTGVVRYSWDGGANWQGNLTLSGVGPSRVALQNVATGANTFKLERVSGHVSLAGVNMKSAAIGVVVHKLGASGSNSTFWSSIDAAVWAEQIAALGTNLAGGLLGTNDQSGDLTPSVFAANVETLISALLAENPAIDRLWISPPENARENSVPMTAYAGAMEAAAASGAFAFLDLQDSFGPDVEDYKFGSSLGLLDASDLHPAPATGGALISTALLAIITPLRLI